MKHSNFLARLVSHTHTLAIVLLFMMGAISQVSGQGTIVFSAPTVDPVSKLRKVDIIWSNSPSVMLSGMRVQVNLSALNGIGNPCVNESLTVSSTNPVFGPIWPGVFDFITGNVIFDINTPAEFAWPGGNVTLFSIFLGTRPGETIQLALPILPPPYYRPGLKQIGGAGAFTTVSFPAATLSGFIERTGNPAPQCVNVPNAGIPNVSIGIGSSSNDPCLGIVLPNAGTGNTGSYQQVVHHNLNYTITPTKNNGTSCGVTSLDAGIISDHIIGEIPFTDVYQYYAADVNINNQVTTLDVVVLNTIINGTFVPPVGFSPWRFIPTVTYFGLPLPPVNFANNTLIIPPSSITRSNVQGDAPNLNFVAIKRADLNQSCSTCDQANFQSGGSEDRQRKSLVELSVKPTMVRAGEKYALPLLAKDLNQAFSFSFGLNYDQSLFMVESVEAGNLPIALGAIAFDDDKGSIKYAWTSDIKGGYTLSDNESLLVIHLVALRDGSIDNTDFRMDTKTIPNDFYDVSMTEGHAFAMAVNSETVSHLLSCVPNPFNGEPTISLELPSDGFVTLSIMDMAGRTVLRMSQWADTGTLNWQPETAGMASGIYICRYETQQGSGTIKIVKN